MSITGSRALSTVTTNGLINIEISKNTQRPVEKKNPAFLEALTDKNQRNDQDTTSWWSEHRKMDQLRLGYLCKHNTILHEVLVQLGEPETPF